MTPEQIAALYRAQSSAILATLIRRLGDFELNRAIAIAMAEGTERGLTLLDELEARGELDDYHLLAAARAGRRKEAAESYRRALVLGGNEGERRFLARRLREVTISPSDAS